MKLRDYPYALFLIALLTLIYAFDRTWTKLAGSRHPLDPDTDDL